MSKITRYLDEQDVQRINTAIEEAEAQTAAEIVCVAAASSGRYDRAEDIFGLMLGLLSAVLVWLSIPDATPGGDTWAGYLPTTKIALMGVAIVLGFVMGAIVSSYVWGLRRPFIPKRQKNQCVTRAASAAFFDRSLHRTAGGTGLLIYLSMDERRAVLLADDAVLEALGQPTLDTLCRDLTTLLADTDPAEALCQTLRRAGDALTALPPDPDTDSDSQNKLPNELILVG
ncbi:MAG: hypothetical protein AAF086_01815 [Planctomycetota bacterium]